MLLWCTEIKTRIFFNFQTLMTNDLSPFSNLTTRLKSLQMHAMALAMTIMRVKTSTIRNTVKHWVGYQWTAMKAVAKKKSHVISRRIKNVSRANWKNVKHPKAQTTNKKACQKVKRPRRRMETTFKKF